MKIRPVLPALTLLLAAPAVAQPTPKPADLVGTWKETARSGPGQAATYTDTTRIEFLPGNEYTWGRPTGFIYRGTYTVANRVLDFGSRTFTILGATPGSLRLRDADGGLFTFTRYTQAPERTDNTAATSGQRSPNTVQTAIPASFSAYLGRWEVYKRTSSTPTAARSIPDYATLLRVIDVKANAGGEQGLVYAAADTAGKPSWYVDRYQNGVFYCKGKSDRALKVLRGTAVELVVEEGDVTYFFRKAQ